MVLPAEISGHPVSAGHGSCDHSHSSRTEISPDYHRNWSQYCLRGLPPPPCIRWLQPKLRRALYGGGLHVWTDRTLHLLAMAKRVSMGLRFALVVLRCGRHDHTLPSGRPEVDEFLAMGG